MEVVKLVVYLGASPRVVVQCHPPRSCVCNVFILNHNAKDKKGRTALHYAVLQSHQSLTEFLLRASLNSTPRSPLSPPPSPHHKSGINLADVADNEGSTALHIALWVLSIATHDDLLYQRRENIGT
jgi:hypothetical protein